MTLWAADASAAEAGVARDTPVASASIQSEIEELRAEIDAFRHDHERRWIDEIRRDEICAAVADVIADAGSRASFAEGGFTAGWNKGFKLVSPDGAFSLKLSGEMQLWYVVNHRRGDQDLPRNPPGTLWGAENRRTRLRFSGHVGDPSIQYLVQATIPPVVGPFLLEFGSIRFVLSPEIDVEVGQFRPQFLREWNVPVFNQLAVNRSVVAAYFSPGFAQGVQLSWKTDRLKLVGWFGYGIGARMLGPARTNSMNTPWHRTPTRWAFTGRAEWKPMGEWSQFNDFTSPPDSPTGLLVGVDVMGQEVGAEIPFAEGTVVLGSSADVSLELGGASMMVSGGLAAPGVSGIVRPESVGTHRASRGLCRARRRGLRAICDPRLRLRDRGRPAHRPVQRIHCRVELVRQSTGQAHNGLGHELRLARRRRVRLDRDLIPRGRAGTGAPVGVADATPAPVLSGAPLGLQAAQADARPVD